MSAVHFLSRSSVYVISSNAIGSFLLFYYYLFGIFWEQTLKKQGKLKAQAQANQSSLRTFGEA